MSQLGMEHEHHHPQHDSGYQDGSHGWLEHANPYSHSQHQSPVHEYSGFAFAPMEPLYQTQMQPPRTTHQQLQPLIMPQVPQMPPWPSMLTSQSQYIQPLYQSTPGPVAPVTTPISAVSTTSTGSRTSSTPRKTLTDADRRKMCLYHEEHPTVKQTEIGAMFGVERSTVSKVLRQKEKYLYQDDGSRSPIRKCKGKFPDIERALSNWARNQQRKGLKLNDETIREKARFFATTVGNSDSHLKVNSTSWLEKFKQKNNLMGAKSRKNSLAEESEASNPPSNAQTPSGISPASPSGVTSPSPVKLPANKSEDTLKSESPETFVDFSTNHRPFHSQSNTSLSSVFTDAAASSFSGGPTSPTSPFFTPDSACGASPFVPQGRASISNGSFQRPRSQTFPMLGIEQDYMSPPASSEPLTPKNVNGTTIDSPRGRIMTSLGDMDENLQTSQAQTSGTMQPPPRPASTGGPTVTIPVQPQQIPSLQSTPISPESISPSSPSQDDARRALELVMNFFRSQPQGFVEPQDYMTMGKLMEKLSLQRNHDSSGMTLPGGLHRVLECEQPEKQES